MSLFGSVSSGPAPGVETCMSIAASLATGPQSQSFEEVRIADYLTSYRSTGRGPPPCPPYPTEPAARAAQGLPPLFVPAPFPGSATTSPFGGAPASSPFGVGGGIGGSAGASTSTASTITDPARLPLPQVFAAPVAVGGAGGSERESFTSIASAPEYAHWSHEELRYHAYLRGMRAPPPATPPFVLHAPSASTSTSLFPAAPSASGPFAPSASGPFAPGLGGGLGLGGGGGGAAGAVGTQDAGDTFMTITTRPEFAGHSFEEHRLAFLRHATELTSAQIFASSSSSPGSSQPSSGSLPPSLSLTISQNQQPANSGILLRPAFPHTPQTHTPQQAQTLFSGATPTHVPQTLFSGATVFGGAPPQPQPTPAQGTSIFGTPAPAPSIFGAPSIQTQTQTPAQARTSIFGAPAPALSTPAAQPTGFSFGSAAPPTQTPAAPPPQNAFGAPQQPQQGQQPQFSFGATPLGSGGTGGAGGGGTGFSFGARRF
ncbi:hypothetical protein C8R45DRAFT_1212649 [Mycena sanguinolenta]|nr:hypothetical protein C8R45DRAFT_1212649 [Mycena sanguinolenta]